MSAAAEAAPRGGDDAEMLAKWREVREQIAADEAAAAAKVVQLQSEQAGLKVDRERLGEVQNEIKDAAAQASSLDQQSAAALSECGGELARASRVATEDALRLQASLPGLEREAGIGEGKLAAFRTKAAADLKKVKQHLSDVDKLLEDRAAA